VIRALVLGGLALAVVTASSAAAAAAPMLQVGNSGPSVVNWQRILDTWLGASGTAVARRFKAEHGLVTQDGIFGRETQAATRAFQREVRIRTTGVVDRRTMVAWIGANVTCCGAGYPRVGPGEVNASVAWWQVALDRWLASRNASQLLVDGIFGPATRAATSSFQKAVGLRPTGIAGRGAWNAMAGRDLVHLP
jgi:peptidoglycan hydrolase-like protein with peptidoglycan-binding domain